MADAPLTAAELARHEARRHAEDRGLTGLEFEREVDRLCAEIVAAGAAHSTPLTPEERELNAEFTRLGPRRRREPFLEAEVVSAMAAARGNWTRQRGTSRAQRPQARRTSRISASRDGPSRSSDDLPLARLRGFAAASTRMVQHLERRRAAMRLA